MRVCFQLSQADLIFKSSPPFYVRYACKQILQVVFNLNRYTRELYEENFCYLLPLLRDSIRDEANVSRLSCCAPLYSVWKLLSSGAMHTERFPRRTPNSSQRPEPQLMNCLLLSRYGRLGASSRMRFYQYLPFLESQHIHVETAALLDDSYIRNLNSGNSTDWASILGSYLKRVRSLARSRRFDLVWVEAEVFPWLPGLGRAMVVVEAYSLRC